ncbi:response regulator receiver modulated serine phosphatase [Candidatus Vecturithrix granuli]|uniref:histidine kinase n=1 Tax=Vecturithrix granuli TaxID=1499967 RepID=A0A081C9D3_VECG1|nr:response regulator receiver modulated serine phosphatase [Candidatus Vecturithrix granuli]
MGETQEQLTKILVVDDYAENVELVQELLTTNGYQVTTAYSGEEALEKIHREIPDLILLDIMMPKMDGYEVCEELRKDEETKDIPIIFVTAKTEVKDWTHAIFNIGVNSYITKPINPKKLLEKVKSVLRMKQSRDELRKTREKLSKTIGDSAEE